LFKLLAHALLAYGYLPLHLTHAMLYSQQLYTTAATKLLNYGLCVKKKLETKMEYV